METTSEIIENLKKIAHRVFKDTPVLFAYICGSYAAGLSHSFSDLDSGTFGPGVRRKAGASARRRAGAVNRWRRA